MGLRTRCGPTRPLWAYAPARRCLVLTVRMPLPVALPHPPPPPLHLRQLPWYPPSLPMRALRELRTDVARMELYWLVLRT